MPHHSSDSAERALNRLHRPPAFGDHRAARARNQIHAAPTRAAPTRIIEIGEVTAGIAVPESGGVRFFSSDRDFDPLDGALFRSVEQAAKAARERFRAMGAVSRASPRNARPAPELRAG